MDYTIEQQKKIGLVRLYIGDTQTSPFYPIFSDDEIASILESQGWDLKKGIRYTAIAASMQFAQVTYRERTGDIEVWNNVSLQYQKALKDLISDNSIGSLESGLMPYFGGISWKQVGEIVNNPDQVRSSLTWESHTVPLLAGASGAKQTYLDTDYSKTILGLSSNSPYAIVVEE